MNSTQNIPNKIFNIESLERQVKRWKLLSKKISFTNGVFDLLHKGHIASLTQAASFGEILVVGINSDDSVKKLKGPTRPINDEETRSIILSNLLMVDAVIIFNEDTPINLIKTIMPDVLVKGGDYTIEQIVGAKEVIENGGQVIIADIIDGISTTNTISKMKHP
jgi:D-beta-D-heptose 7-phosphate kinase/D-beta-D-heptose 1-phosphate adenosyltransferase